MLLKEHIWWYFVCSKTKLLAIVWYCCFLLFVFFPTELSDVRRLLSSVWGCAVPRRRGGKLLAERAVPVIWWNLSLTLEESPRPERTRLLVGPLDSIQRCTVLHKQTPTVEEEIFLGNNASLSFLILLFVSGKEVVLLMQALNSLATPEEKLAALCKKYADLVRWIPGSLWTTLWNSSFRHTYWLFPHTYKSHQNNGFPKP